MNKRIYNSETRRARSRTGNLKRRTTTDAAYAVTRARFGNIDRDYIRLVKAVFSDYIKEVVNQILDGMSFRIPMRLGTLLVVRCKKLKRIDWKLTRELGKRVFHKNYDSDGDSMKFKWNKQDGYSLFVNMQFFKYIPTRNVKRLLNKKIKSQYIDYALHTINNNTR